jgi:hypothetical protein
MPKHRQGIMPLLGPVFRARKERTLGSSAGCNAEACVSGSLKGYELFITQQLINRKFGRIRASYRVKQRSRSRDFASRC